MPRTRSIDELIIAHRVIKILKVRSAVLFPGLFFMNWRQSGDTKLINRYHPVRDFGSIRRDYLDFFFLSIFFLFFALSFCPNNISFKSLVDFSLFSRVEFYICAIFVCSFYYFFCYCFDLFYLCLFVCFIFELGKAHFKIEFLMLKEPEI